MRRIDRQEDNQEDRTWSQYRDDDRPRYDDRYRSDKNRRDDYRRDDRFEDDR